MWKSLERWGVSELFCLTRDNGSSFIIKQTCIILHKLKFLNGTHKVGSNIIQWCPLETYVKQSLILVWDKKELKYADTIFIHRAGFFSNLEKNQRLLSRDKSGENDIMVSWWPWGHGATISVRLFCANTQPFAKPISLFSRLRNLFKSSHWR